VIGQQPHDAAVTAMLTASRTLVAPATGFGAVALRYLIYFLTWLAAGHSQFGQDGYVGSSHLPRRGPGFHVLIPVAGGLVYGPVICRWAREARGHGVPEVMISVAENGGRSRPQVSVVKALASAICIRTGGSVGRERGRSLQEPRPELTLAPGDRVSLLAPMSAPPQPLGREH
jgi:H+/Cl- antiporter ClcA